MFIARRAISSSARSIGDRLYRRRAFQAKAIWPLLVGGARTPSADAYDGRWQGEPRGTQAARGAGDQRVRGLMQERYSKMAENSLQRGAAALRFDWFLKSQSRKRRFERM
jgi:hypothetical protein